MRPAVSIVIPAFNEAATIGTTLKELSAYIGTTGLQTELIVVDDGSTDATASVVEEYVRSLPSLRLIRLGKNQGKGAAVRRGVLEARGEVIAFLDADLPYRV